MKIPIYQVDAFTNSIFSGNPAAICPLESWLDDGVLQRIATENNLSETAFFVKTPSKPGHYHLRWFTPVFEIDLCGHATLASAHVLFTHLNISEKEIVFTTLSGDLKVVKNGNLLTMDFPSRVPERIDLSDTLISGLGVKPLAVHKSRDIMAVFENEQIVRDINPDFQTLAELDVVGIIVTAPGNEVDFVSRFFAPRAGVNEDPVTGSAHSTLTPYWADRLNKNTLLAVQLSQRGGKLICTLKGDRVLLQGSAVTYLIGSIHIPA